MSSIVDESTFTAEVLESPLPVLVNFWAPWCGLCRLIEPLLQDLHGEWAGRLHLVSVNADENLRLANQYRLTTLPTLLFFKDGSLCYRLEGFRGREDLRLALESQIRLLNFGQLSAGGVSANRPLEIPIFD